MSSGSQIVEIKSPLSFGNAGRLTGHGLLAVYTVGAVVVQTSTHRLDKKNCLHGHRVKENPWIHPETALP